MAAKLQIIYEISPIWNIINLNVVNPIHFVGGMVARCATNRPRRVARVCERLTPLNNGDKETKMANIIISIDEEQLDNKLRKLLAERQSKGLLTVERVEVTNYLVTPPTKRGTHPRKKPRPEDFVGAVKYIANHAALQNGQTLTIIVNGLPTKYCFWLDNEKWCDTMDKLLEDHRDVLDAALERKFRADSVNLLAAYVGEIIDLGLFQKTRIQKTDLIKSFSAYYGKPMSSVQTKLSTSYPGWSAFNDLVDETNKIAIMKGK